MKTFKRGALFVLLTLLPACGRQLVEFPQADGAQSDAARTDVVTADRVSGDAKNGDAANTDVAGIGDANADVASLDDGIADAGNRDSIGTEIRIADVPLADDGSRNANGTDTPSVDVRLFDVRIVDGSINDISIVDALFVDAADGAPGPGADARILLTNGTKASNVWWHVASSATLGSYSEFQGNIVAAFNITMKTGGTACGRSMAGAWVGGAGYIFDSNTLSVPGNGCPL